MNTIIKINEFSFAYTVHDVLREISLEIKEKKCLGLLGSNGSGKTTLIKCIIGELKGRGQLRVFDNNPDINCESFKRNIGIVLDNDLLIDYLTLEEYLWFVGKTYKIKSNLLQSKIGYWVDYFRLKEDRKRLLKYFSHGMRKKTQIIASIIHEPKILIVDEPTNGLDIEMVYYLKQLILELKKSEMAILISTHNLAFVEEVCDSVAIINNGKIITKLDLKENTNLEKIFIKKVIESRNENAGV